MYVEPIKVSPRDVAHIIQATFPEYRGRTVKVQPRERVSLSNLNWDGGSPAVELAREKAHA